MIGQKLEFILWLIFPQSIYKKEENFFFPKKVKSRRDAIYKVSLFSKNMKLFEKNFDAVIEPSSFYSFNLSIKEHEDLKKTSVLGRLQERLRWSRFKS